MGSNHFKKHNMKSSLKLQKNHPLIFNQQEEIIKSSLAILESKKKEEITIFFLPIECTGTMSISKVVEFDHGWLNYEILSNGSNENHGVLLQEIFLKGENPVDARNRTMCFKIPPTKKGRELLLIKIQVVGLQTNHLVTNYIVTNKQGENFECEYGQLFHENWNEYEPVIKSPTLSMADLATPAWW